MSQELHQLKIKRQEALAVFLRERLIHDMALVIVEGWTAFMKVGSYLYDPKDMVDDERQDAYMLSVLVRTMSKELEQPGMFVELDNPHGRKNRHLLKDLERGLNQIDPALTKRFLRLRDHLGNLSRAIQNVYESPDSVEQQRKLIALSKQRENVLESACARAILIKKRRETEFSPEALVLQGGGAKGISYSGVTEWLERMGLLENIRFVAGTSAGAMMGVLIALGFKAEEVKEIAQKGRFAQFFAEATLPVSFWAKYGDRAKDAVKTGWNKLLRRKHLTATDTHASPHTEGFMLKDFSKSYMLPMLTSQTGLTMQHLMKADEEVVHQELKELEHHPREGRMTLSAIYKAARAQFLEDMGNQGMRKEAETLQFAPLLGRTEAFQGAVQCIRVAKAKLEPESETIEEFIGDIIQYRLDKMPAHMLEKIDPPLKTRSEKRNISFSQLQQLARHYPNEGFKEFGVSLTDHFMPTSFKGVGKFTARLVKKSMEAVTGKTPVFEGLGAQDNRFFFRPVLARAANPDGRFGELQHMPIKTAVRASMNLPLLFPTMEYQGLNVIDGGTNNNLPFNMHSDRFDSVEEADAKTIGFILSPLESDLEFQAVDDLIRNKDGKLRIILDEEIRDQMREYEINGLKTGDSTTVGILNRFWGKAKITAMRAVSVSIRNFMAHHNSTPLSEAALNNISTIHSGSVDTADFHISLEQRQALHTAGEIAALNLLSLHEDRHYRYAICRLRSLTLQEKLLSEKLGIEPFAQGLLDTYDDEHMLRAALADPQLDRWGFGEVLQGRV
ncbi:MULTISPECIES: patatin-like phospholipase family protein [Pseudomonas]|uniref:patatin-like phospholipase family protein n=1 Tax=Pseudomonas TaxID=286 RepID=UPI000F03FC2F|nr:MULTISPECIES: patatin-like phospholipase family protein [Pseudomonas]MBD8682134.1 patatin-like phospholipase family protein [Pseudomonas sp. CFBP 13719]